MANMHDARILYTLWARRFDPSAPTWEQLATAVREAWLLVAAGARMLNDLPEPDPYLRPGHLFLASWNSRDSWKGDAPRRPAISFVLDGSPYTFVIEPEADNVPIISTCLIKPATFHRIPGLIYEEEAVADPLPLAMGE